MSFLRKFILFPVVAVLSVCCTGGYTEESPGRFVSEVEMTDSSAVYDLWLTVRMQGDFKDDHLPVDVVVFSPDSRYRAEERFVLPVAPCHESGMTCQSNTFRAFTSGYAYDMEYLYRTNIRPDIYGVWVISMATASESVSGIWARIEKN